MGYPVRPSGYVGWGSTGMTNVAEPLDSKKATGWSVNEQPPSSYFNWIQSKQDEWIQYLAWRTSLSPVVQEDFCLPAPWGVNLHPTMWRADWNASGNAGGQGWCGSGGMYYANLALPGGMRSPPNGYVSNLGGNDGWQQLSKPIGTLGPVDFRMEVIFMEQVRGASGNTVELGLFNTTGASAAFPQAAFMWTAPSGVVHFHYHPSGGGSTAVSLGFNSMTGATGWGFHRYVAESRGATLALYLDDTLVTAVRSPGYFGIPTGVDFGVRMAGAAGNNTKHSIDKLELLLGR